jgi:hypothetical protein
MFKLFKRLLCLINIFLVCYLNYLSCVLYMIINQYGKLVGQYPYPIFFSYGTTIALMQVIYLICEACMIIILYMIPVRIYKTYCFILKLNVISILYGILTLLHLIPYIRYIIYHIILFNIFLIILYL